MSDIMPSFILRAVLEKNDLSIKKERYNYEDDLIGPAPTLVAVTYRISEESNHTPKAEKLLHFITH